MKRVRLILTVILLGLLLCPAVGYGKQEQAKKKWRKYVKKCLDTLIARGTDVYGPQKTPLLMAIIDVRTLKSPAKPLLLDGLVRTEGRLHRRAERGSNVWYDQKTLAAMYKMTKLTGDPKYAKAADACLAYFLEHCHKANGLLVWGTHIYWDSYKDRAGGDGGGRGPHEILIHHPEWGRMYRRNPGVVSREVEKIWQWHICDKKTGQHNRHDDGRPGCDFAFSGGSFAMAFSFMYSVTKEKHYLDKARLVADWHWKHRNRDTGLVADAPSTGGRYDAKHCFTSVTGPHVSQLLRCYELTGDTHFRDIAISYIKAYEKYGWDKKARTYYGMLKLDGTPVP